MQQVAWMTIYFINDVITRMFVWSSHNWILTALCAVSNHANSKSLILYNSIRYSVTHSDEQTNKLSEKGLFIYHRP